MKAPDKIYVGIQDMGSGYVYNLSLDNNGEQEYIRKDALMEWLEECKNNPVITDLQKGNIQELIDKINSL